MRAFVLSTSLLVAASVTSAQGQSTGGSSDFLACYNFVGADADLANALVGSSRSLTFQQYGPGTGLTKNPLTFVTDETITATKLFGRGASGLGPLFIVAVTPAYFEWLVRMNEQYHGVYVSYAWTTSGGIDNLDRFHVGLPPPALGHCAAPNPNGS